MEGAAEAGAGPAGAAQVWTVARALAWTGSRFERAGTGTPRLDAELLLAKALGCERVDLYTSPDRPLSGDERSAYRALIERRLTGEPVAYILGTKSFRYLALRVSPSVLVPRPETELLVEAAIEFAAGEPVVAADIGTGSGAIAISIAKEIVGSMVYGTDASAGALELARANAEAAGLTIGAGEDAGSASAGAVWFCHGDLLSPLPDHARGRLDAIVSNPPYVTTAGIEKLPREIRGFEPRGALDGGPDGMDYHRRLAAETPSYLRTGGLIALEIGADQADSVSEMLADGFRDVQVKRDLAGLDRVVTGIRK